jgi:cation diffusion facilitator CzcD-associated flavoprotein CzcO
MDQGFCAPAHANRMDRRSRDRCESHHAATIPDGPRLAAITSSARSRARNLWTVTARREYYAVEQVYTCRFSWKCQGCCDHENPYVSDWMGLSDYQGRFVQARMQDPAIAVAGKRVLAIGSGATAATMVSALCDAGTNVTMLQRPPSCKSVVRAQIMSDQDALKRRSDRQRKRAAASQRSGPF